MLFASPLMNHRKLTIGMCCYDDFDGVYFTIQSIRLHHPEVLHEIEFLILDTNPTSEHGKAVKRFAEWVKEPMRYIPVTNGTGTSTRGRIFDMAKTPYVLCLDCHVLLAPGALRKLIDGMDAGYDLGCLLQGPMLYDNISMATHMAHVWRDGMLGIWAVAWRCSCGATFQTSKRERDGRNFTDFQTMAISHISIGACQSCGVPFPADLQWEGHERGMVERGYCCAAEGEPFVIPAHGLGLFACRKDSWLGFNPRFRGFGGEECYIHEKFRQAGKTTICLPWLRWLHRFERPAGVPYQAPWSDRIRNYLIGHIELGLDMAPMVEHFRVRVPEINAAAILATL
jgi:hypothetical protein